MPIVSVTQRLEGLDSNTFPYDTLVTWNADVVAGGASLIAAANALTAGQVLALQPGLYRIPSNANFTANNITIATYGGPGLAIISGADDISASWTTDSPRWYKGGLTFQSRDSLMRDGTYSVCDISAVDGTNLCWDRDQVWMDGARMKRVASIAAGDAGTGARFFTDRTAGRVYIWTNPSGHTFEINNTPYFANDAAATGVTLRRLQVEKFASPLQRSGTTVTGSGWTVDRCVFYGNHASGLHFTNVANLHVMGCRFEQNGQIGMTVGSTSSSTAYSNNIIENCNFLDNNQEDFYYGDWEAGGFKTTSKSGGIVRNCTFTNDKGLALWVDFGAQWTFDNNTINGPLAQAIRIEVAQNCIVSNNVITNSGSNIGDHYRAAHSNWSTVFDTCAISISECQYVECFNNTVNDPTLNGIIVNIRGRQNTHHVFVHDNIVEQRQAPVPTGDVGTGTTGTMIAGGMAMLSAPNAASYYFNTLETWTMPGGSGAVATKLVQVSGNHYRVGDLGTTARFTYINGAGTGTSYMTANAYKGATKNPDDGTDIVV